MTTTPPPVTPPPATPAYAPAPVEAKFNVLAIVGFILAFVISLGAVIVSHIALSQIKRTGERGRPLAIAGLILGYLGILGGIIAVIASIALAATGHSTYSSY